MIEKLNHGVSAEMFEPSEKNKFELNRLIILFVISNLRFAKKSIFLEINDRTRNFVIGFRSTDKNTFTHQISSVSVE